MIVSMKRLTALGCSTALTGLMLSGCGAPPDTDGSTNVVVAETEAPSAPVAAVGESGEGEGGEAGEAGEGGEGGVDVARAANDPAEYRKALAVTEAHVLAARDAIALGERDAAAEMFAHPVTEVLIALEGVFEAQGVEPFSEMLVEASTAIFNGATAEDIETRSEAILAALDAASAKAPASDRSGVTVAAEVIADQIERAAQQYGSAIESGVYEPYLDGYGFYKTAERLYGLNQEAIVAANPALTGAIEAALVALGDAYPSAVLPDTLDADRGALVSASSAVMLAL